MLVVNVTDDDATASAFSRGCCKVNGITRHKTKSCLWSTAQVTSIDFDFCNLSSSGDVVYKERAGDIDNSWLLIYAMILCAFKGKPQSVEQLL
jgi:hypothetical protein